MQYGVVIYTWANISIGVSHLHTLQVPPNSEAEEHDLNGWQEELDKQ